MEIKTVKVPKYKTIKDGYIERKIIVARDGKEFNFREMKQAKEYERGLETFEVYEKMEKIYIQQDDDFLGVNGVWHCPQTEKELEILLDRIYHGTYCDNHFNGKRIPSKKDVKINIGDWVFNVYNDYGDCRPDNSIITLDYVEEQYKSFLNKLKKEK